MEHINNEIMSMLKLTAGSVGDKDHFAYVSKF